MSDRSYKFNREYIYTFLKCSRMSSAQDGSQSHTIAALYGKHNVSKHHNFMNNGFEIGNSLIFFVNAAFNI